jgi:hypothetical protein
MNIKQTDRQTDEHMNTRTNKETKRRPTYRNRLIASSPALMRDT